MLRSGAGRKLTYVSEEVGLAEGEKDKMFHSARNAIAI